MGADLFCSQARVGGVAGDAILKWIWQPEFVMDRPGLDFGRQVVIVIYPRSSAIVTSG